MTNPKTLLKATNLTKVYDMGKEQISALDGVNLEVYEGELLAIIGKSKISITL